MKDNSLQVFIKSCDDMIKGKFIMADNKISKILEAIANNEKLYNLINRSINGYNFQKEYERIYKESENGLFEVSKDTKKNIAFVMCLFVEVDQHRIKFYDFVNKFFKNAGAGNEYEDFVEKMLKPFKEGVIMQYNMENIVEETKEEYIPTKEEKTIYDDIIEQLKIIKNEVAFTNKISPKKKEEINIYLVGCIEAVKYKNKKLISALITALDKEIKNQKVLKESYNKLISLYLEIYS